uniref:Uncharacterized protein n=1 Tax=Anopheles farauti TaxID=69004 RepID=A0A182QTD6_9DIPT
MLLQMFIASGARIFSCNLFFLLLLLLMLMLLLLLLLLLLLQFCSGCASSVDNNRDLFLTANFPAGEGVVEDDPDDGEEVSDDTLEALATDEAAARSRRLWRALSSANNVVELRNDDRRHMFGTTAIGSLLMLLLVPLSDARRSDESKASSVCIAKDSAIN